METTTDTCPCGSNVAYNECCLPLIKGDRPALTAEELMRSRYSAYAMKEIGYLLSSLHPDHRQRDSFMKRLPERGLKALNGISLR